VNRVTAPWHGSTRNPRYSPTQPPFAARCVKDRIDEAQFAHRRDVTSEFSVVFPDTTSPHFHGQSGETRGRQSHSKEHRADHVQKILCVVTDGAGRA